VHIEASDDSNDNVIATNKAISANLLLDSVYSNIEPLSNSENTCLSPIKDFFADFYSPQFSKINYVFELLAQAEKKRMLKECVSLSPEDSNSNIVTLPKYTMAEIKNKIRVLSLQSISLNNN
jgi:hypothetical protein